MHSTGTQPQEVTDLEKLAAELGPLGLEAALRILPGRLPYLDVCNPRAHVLAEKVFADDSAFWWSWAERIAPRDNVATAASIVARVLRTVDGR